MEALEEPYRKSTVNFFASDIEAMERLYGRGWTEVVRNLVRYHVKEKTKPITVGDIINEQ